MHPFIAVFLCSQALLASPISGEQQFPYRAYVIADEVYIRSGPGQSYYPTDKLKQGQKVEVYRHDPGGWCAVRPVEGSFTWVSGRFLQPIGGNLAKITDEGISARVGSCFSDIRDVIQVRLHKDEVVEILEEPRDGDIWFKIAPPAGEFRWVSDKYLDPDYPRDGIGRRGERRERERDVPPSADESLHARSAEPRAVSPDEFKEELESIELELAVMVIEPPSAWTFDELRARTNVLLDNARTAVERGRARLLANRIARFDDIKQRQEEVLAMRERTDRAGRMWARLRPGDAVGESPKSLAKNEDRFDGVGRLTRVESPKQGAPRYALMDQSNEVICYVTPAPGVNLHDYLGEQIGVNGTRGYMPEQQTNHVMARHVTPLEGRMLR